MKLKSYIKFLIVSQMFSDGLFISTTYANINSHSLLIELQKDWSCQVTENKTQCLAQSPDEKNRSVIFLSEIEKGEIGQIENLHKVLSEQKPFRQSSLRIENKLETFSIEEKNIKNHFSYYLIYRDEEKNPIFLQYTYSNKISGERTIQRIENFFKRSAESLNKENKNSLSPQLKMALGGFFTLILILSSTWILKTRKRKRFHRDNHRVR